MQDIATLGLRVDASQVSQADRALQSFERAGQRADNTTDRLNSTLARMQRMAGAVAAALSAREIIGMADAYANMTGRLNLVVKSQEQLIATQRTLYDMAQRTRSQLTETVDLYTKIARSTADLNKTDAERLRLTESINKATIISGGSAQTAAAGLQQLGQALGSGVLRGEEFNSIMENTPRLAQALADGLGRTRGELRAMAEAGKLTTDVVLGALESQAGVIDAEFAKMPKTVGQAMTQVQNSLLQTIGVMDQQGQASAGLAELLSDVANNMQGLVAALTAVAAVGGARWVVGFVAAMRAKAVATAAATAADRAAAMEALRSAAQQTAAAATVANAQLAQANAAVAAATGFKRLELQINLLAPAQARATAAGAAHVAAMNAQALAASRMGAAVTFGARAIGLLSGPLGWILTALSLGATAWAMWGNKAEEAEAKVEKTLSESTEEIVADLDRQIEKLEQRNRLMKVDPKLAKAESPAADQVRAVLAEIERVSKDASINDAARTEILRVLGAQYGVLTEKMDRAADAQRRFTESANVNKFADWLEKNGQYATDAEKLAAAIKKAKEELGDAYNSKVEARITAAFSKKDTKEAEQIAKTARDYLEQLQRERAEIGKTEAQIRMLDAARAASKAPTLALKQAIVAAAAALNTEIEAQDKAKAEKERYTKAIEAEAEARLQERLAAQASVDRLQFEVDTYGMGAAAISRYTIAKLEERKATLMLAGAGEKEIEQLDALIGKNQELLALQNQKDALDSMFETTKVETFGQALREAFGEAGNSLAQLGSVLEDYLDKQTAAERDRAKAKMKFAGDDKRIAQEIGKINSREEKDRISAYANMAGAAKGFFKEHTLGYKLLEGAERAFRLYELASNAQVLAAKLTATTVSTTASVAGNAQVAASAQASAAQQVAANMQVGMSSAAAGVANQAQGDPYSAWGRMAAMAAVMAALGFAVSSIGGGSTNTANHAENVQKMQGTGGVFGDSSAKSDSIAKSLELLESNSDMMLPLTQGMLASLRSIDAAMSGLSNIVLRTSGITDGSNMGVQTGTNPIGGLAVTTSKFFGGFGPMGQIMGSLASAIIGKVTKEITDSGIQFSGRVADLQNGRGFNQYANVTTTKSRLFGLSKSTSDSVQTAALDAQVAQQFGLVFKNLEGVLSNAAAAVGADADAVGTSVRNYNLELTKLSLKGLKGDELQAAVSAALSKATDDVAMAALPGFDAFRKVGEGYAETVIRVASGVEQAGLALDRLGVTAIAYSDIANKQGDVGAEIVRQSILAREGMSGVGDIMRTLSGSAADLADTYGELLAAQDQMRMVGMDPSTLGVGMIRGAGGLDALQKGLSDYFEGFFTEAEQVAAKTESLRDKFAALGLEMPASIAGFRHLVESTPALNGQLLLLAGSFAELMDSAGDASELSKQRRQLEIEIMRLSGDELGAVAAERAIELSAMDASLHALQKQAWALRDEADLREKNLRDSMDVLRRAVEAEKAAKTKAHAETLKGYEKAMEATRTKITNLTSLSQALNGARDQVGVQDEDKARAQAQAALQATLATARAGGINTIDAKALQKTLATLSQDSVGQFGSEREYLNDRYSTAIAVGELADMTDAALSVEERNLKALEALRDEENMRFDAEMLRLDGILENAQRQLDAINGVNVSVQSVAAALAGFAASVRAGAGGGFGPSGGGTASNGSFIDGMLTSAYQNYLGRAPDASGWAFYQEQIAKGVNINTIVADIADSAEAKSAVAGLYEKVLGRSADASGLDFYAEQIAKGAVNLSDIEASMRDSEEYKNKVPGFANGGRHAGGWRVVGEVGRELEYTGPSQIVSNSSIEDKLDNRKVVAAVEEQTDELKNALIILAGYMQRAAQAGEDANRLTVDNEE